MFYRLLLILLMYPVEQSISLDCFITLPISNMPDNCTTIFGDLLIDGQDTTDVLANHFQYSVLVQKFVQVEQWEGSIQIFNTGFQNLSFFRSLKTVYNSWTSINLKANINYASFWIESNENLTSLGMPNILSIIADVLPTNFLAYAFIINNNKKLCFSEEEYWKWRNMDRSYLYEILICEKKPSKNFCFEDFFTSENIPLGCQILMSGVWLKDITNTSLQSHLNDAFSTVEEVHGPIVIFRTDFDNLSFPLLHTIRNQYYDGQNSWQWQLLIIRGNYYMTNISFPKLVNFHHFGNQEQVTNTANYLLHYTEETCNLVRKIPFFHVTDPYSDCGLIPIINDGQFTRRVLLQGAEKAASFFLNLGLCIYLAVKIFSCKVAVNFFHFAILTFILLNMVECLYVNLEYVHIFNDHGFAIPYGVSSMFFTHDSTLFNQISNVMYVNRLSLLISCSIYRSMYILNETYEKYGLVFSCALFALSNVWNLSVMANLGNKYTYVLYPLNWITLMVTIITGIFVKMTFKKFYSIYTDVAKNHNKLSIAFFLQALWSFLFCGYSDGLNNYFSDNYQYVEFVRWWEHFFYWYGGIMIRWHFAMLIIIIIAFLPCTFVKFPQSTKITPVVSISRNDNE